MGEMIRSPELLLQEILVFQHVSRDELDHGDALLGNIPDQPGGDSQCGKLPKVLHFRVSVDEELGLLTVKPEYTVYSTV